MLFRRKKRPAQPSPSWLKWAVVAFILLAALGNMQKTAPQSGSVQQAVRQAAGNLNPHKLLPMADYQNKLFPGYNTSLRMEDISPGQGAPVLCGQRVAIAYEAFTEDGKPIGDRASKDAPLTFRIGDGGAIPALEEGVIGMKTGGKRSLTAPPDMAYGVKNFAKPGAPAHATVRFEVELLEISPPLPDFDSTPYRIATVRHGNGPAIACGQPAKIHFTLWNIEGQKLFPAAGAAPLVTFTPGKSEVFLGLEQGVIGMENGGMRTLIVPPAFQKTMDGNPPGMDFPLPKNQTVLVDVETVP